MIIHTVKRGETPISIATQYGVELKFLLNDNGLTADTPLVVGQSLVILFPDVTYTVKSGDTVYRIAENYGISVKQIYRNNYYLRGKSDLSVGDVVVISYKQEKRRAIEANSYAYTYISDGLLREEVPYLTYLVPFTYGIKENGELVDLNDEKLLETAGEYGVSSLMHLSSLTERGNFSNERANLVLNNLEVQNKLIEAIIANIRKKGYMGLDVDFEFIFPEDKYDYAAFLQELRIRLNDLGYPLYSALAPKTSDTQRGLLYEGHDYNMIGSAANKVLLMTYEWGYTYGPPMAVAPINRVREVVEYANTRIASSKMLLGVPTYGYDWTLPYERGNPGAPSISGEEALSRARRYGAEINFDATAQSPWFRYTDDDGKLHEVWFEDARSILAKFNLADEFDLSGFGYWNLMRPFPQNYTLLNNLYDIK